MWTVEKNNNFSLLSLPKPAPKICPSVEELNADKVVGRQWQRQRGRRKTLFHKRALHEWTLTPDEASRGAPERTSPGLCDAFHYLTTHR